MFKKLLSLTVSLIPVVVLIIIEIVLFKTNYVPDTWLTGWDSTQPEFNFREHFFRDLNAIWQEYRGLGLLDGMAHAANIVHVIYIWLLSLFIPINAVRYIFIHLMHLLGGVGVYFLITYLFKKVNRITKMISGTVASLVYMFNPGVISMFFVPLELFIIHFGFLPWLILVLLKYLDNKSKKNLLLLFFVNLLAVSQFHVPTIFLVYASAVGTILIIYLIKQKAKNLKSLLSATLIIFVVNSFWLIPYTYSAVKNTSVITNSKINVLSNNEIVLRNKAFGDLKSLSLFQSFNLDYEDLQASGKYDYQFSQWRSQWLDKNIELFGYILFGASILGIVFSILDKNVSALPFSILFLFASINLGSEILILSSIRNFLYKFIPYYEEVFRFTFTKFIILYALTFSFFVGYFIKKIASFKPLKLFTILAAIAACLTIFLTLKINKPAFQGQFIYDNLQVNIPDEYFDFFAYFSKKENDGRIIILPQPSMWNWEFNKWGYRGSGIIWQGIDNPIMHRSFDPWSKYNEESYMQLNEAIYNNDLISLENLIQKFGVSWIVLDPSIYQPSGWPEALNLEGIKNLLNASDLIEKTTSFGDMVVYKIKTNYFSSFVFSPRSYWQLQDNSNYLREGQLYNKVGVYVNKPGSLYPFNNLYTDREEGAQIENDNLVFSTAFISDDYELTIPDWLNFEKYAPVELFVKMVGENKMSLRFVGLFPEIKVGQNNFPQNYEQDFILNLSSSPKSKIFISIYGDVFEIDKPVNETHVTSLLIPYNQKFNVNVYDTKEFSIQNLTESFWNSDVRECWKRENSSFKFNKQNTSTGITLSSTDASVCASVDIDPKISKPSLGLLEADYFSTTNSPPHNCFLKFGDSDCDNHSFYSLYAASSNTVHLKLQYELEPGSKYWLDLTGRGQNEKGMPTEVNYNNITLTTFPILGRITLSVDKSFAPKYQEIIVNNTDEMTVTVPLGKNRSISNIIPLTTDKLSTQSKNCDNFQRGSVEKIFENGSINLIAKNKASNCEYLQISNLYPNVSYFLRIAGENISGRNLKFVVNSNQTRRNEIEYSATESKFDELYLLPPPSHGEVFDLNIESRSFGKEVSSNRLEKLEFIPLAVNWLSNIRLYKQGSFIQNSQIDITDTEKIGTGFYKINYMPKGENGLLILNQSYESGWVAFVNINKLEHLVSNSWSNAWEVKSSDCDKNCTITIYYWPQLLQYLGFVLIGGVFLAFLFPLRKIFPNIK